MLKITLHVIIMLKNVFVVNKNILHVFLCLLCSHIPLPPHALHWCFCLLCSQIDAPPHALHLLFCLLFFATCAKKTRNSAEKKSEATCAKKTRNSAEKKSEETVMDCIREAFDDTENYVVFSVGSISGFFCARVRIFFTATVLFRFFFARLFGFFLQLQRYFLFCPK